MSDAPTRSRRDRPAKPALSRDAVLDAALEVLRAEGLAAVTMRRVATALDTGPASLYVYVSDRRELLREMLDRVAGEIRFEAPDPKRWREQLRALCVDMLRVMESYPGIARVPFADIPTGDNALRVSEGMLAILRAGGVDDQSAAWALDILTLFVTATAFESSIYLAEGRDESFIETEQARLQERFAGLSPQEFPHMTALGAVLALGSGEERFLWGLDVLIAGLAAAPPPDAPLV